MGHSRVAVSRQQTPQLPNILTCLLASPSAPNPVRQSLFLKSRNKASTSSILDVMSVLTGLGTLGEGCVLSTAFQLRRTSAQGVGLPASPRWMEELCDWAVGQGSSRPAPRACSDLAPGRGPTEQERR